ncbi:MAG TPA: DUF4880 domain-containing protein [Alphaproteobacteria bacterium]|nr:DUF4880 domain-containing protein [Alphaproteobacteria bacterium]
MNDQEIDLDRQASLWFGALRRRLLTPEERAAFEIWIREPAHAAELAELQRIWLMLGSDDARDGYRASAPAEQPVPHSRLLRSRGLPAMLSAASIAAALLLRLDSPWWTTLDWWSR